MNRSVYKHHKHPCPIASVVEYISGSTDILTVMYQIKKAMLFEEYSLIDFA